MEKKKNTLTVTTGKGDEDNGGKKGKGQVKEHVQRTHGQGQWGGDCLWERGLDETRESNGGRGEMGTNVTEQE